MKRLQLAVVALALALFPAPIRGADKEQKLAGDVRTAVERFKKTDSTIAKHFETAAGYAVYPNVGRGGLVLGAAHGNGQAFEKGVLIGNTSLTQFTVGLQVGGQEFSEIIFFENQAALNRFKKSKVEMSAQIGAVAAAEGVAANAKYVDGVLVITLPKSGLMAEVSVGGQKLKFRPLAGGR